jgi:hypothetical protein
MSVARCPQLGSKPVALSVKLKPSKDQADNLLCMGLQEMYRKGEFTDVVLICAEQRFLAHRVVLAVGSSFLKEGLSASPLPGPDMRHEIRVEVANPEAVKIMLDYLYNLEGNEWTMFNPRTQEINRDVLQLAAQFDLPGLTHRAMHWLGKDLTTGNVVERLQICEDFGLSELSAKIFEQLTYNKAALSEVAHSQQIMSYPKLMQAILQCAASGTPDCGSAPPPGQPKSKRARKA